MSRPSTAPPAVEPASRAHPDGLSDPPPADAEILARLERSECLLCREAADNLHRYYFWFLNERYAHVPTAIRLQRARGFCLRHTILLLERAGDSTVQAHLVEVLAARVAVDRWDAEEFLRKQSWSVRHEPRGSEHTAWLRANARLAGALREGDHAV